MINFETNGSKLTKEEVQVIANLSKALQLPGGSSAKELLNVSLKTLNSNVRANKLDVVCVHDTRTVFGGANVESGAKLRNLDERVDSSIINEFDHLVLTPLDGRVYHFLNPKLEGVQFEIRTKAQLGRIAFSSALSYAYHHDEALCAYKVEDLDDFEYEFDFIEFQFNDPNFKYGAIIRRTGKFSSKDGVTRLHRSGSTVIELFPSREALVASKGAVMSDLSISEFMSVSDEPTQVRHDETEVFEDESYDYEDDYDR